MPATSRARCCRTTVAATPTAAGVPMTRDPSRRRRPRRRAAERGRTPMSIQFDFSGKGVFVTDSAHGLGRHIAAAFHALGAKVAIHDTSPGEAEKTVRELGGGARLLAAPGDLTKAANVAGITEKAIHSLGRLDVLVCCALQGSLRAVDRLSEDDFAQAMGTNTKKAFF